MINNSPYIQSPAYNAARFNYKDQQRTAYLGDADFLIEDELLLIQARSRHIHRNNGLIQGAESKFVAKLKAVSVLFYNAEGKKHALAQELWDELAAKITLDGKGNFSTLQATLNHDRLQSGEAFVRMVVVAPNTDDVRIPLRLQSIESEYCDIKFNGAGAKEPDPDLYKTTRYGITFDVTTNKPKFYWFHTQRYFGHHLQEDKPWIYQKVAAEDMCHIFERRRSNQWRGVPVIAAILQDIYGLEDLTDATIAQQTSAAAISWIVERGNGSVLPPSSLGSATTGMSQETLAKLHFIATGGQVQYTNPGETFKLVQSSDIGSNLIAMLQYVIQTISTTYGLPYYMLSGNTDGLDFSSIRAVLLEFKDYLEYLYTFLIVPDLVEKVITRFKLLAKMQGFDLTDAKPVYRFPKFYGIDELKDTQALLLEMQTGGLTIQRRLRESDITEEEYLEHIKFCKDNGIETLYNVKVDTTANNTQAQKSSTSN
jgi:lambda family phage portal protein